MRLSSICSLSVLAAFALAPLAYADSIYVYDLSSQVGDHGSMAGSITIEGNGGDAVPLLSSADVVSYNFFYTGPGGFDVNSANNNVHAVSDAMNFNGTLGATTLQGTSGTWEITSGPAGSLALFLFGQPRLTNFGEYWGICRVDAPLACYDSGFYQEHWTLTLSSVTDNPAPEPGTVWLGLGVMAAFCVKRAVRA